MDAAYEIITLRDKALAFMRAVDANNGWLVSHMTPLERDTYIALTSYLRQKETASSGSPTADEQQ